MSGISRELRFRFALIGVLSTATVYTNMLIVIQCFQDLDSDDDDHSRLYWYLGFIPTKLFLNYSVLLLEENRENKCFYGSLIPFQLHYLYDVYLSHKRDRKTDSMQVSRFLLVAFECVPLTLINTYLAIENDELSTRRFASICLSVLTIAFVISEIEPSPQYESGYRYYISFGYRIAEVTVFTCVTSLFAAEVGSYVYVALSARYLILVGFSILNQKDEWVESKWIETLAALFFCFCDVGLVLWTAKLSNLNDPSIRENYFVIYRASIRSFSKALLLQDSFNICMFCIGYFLADNIDSDVDTYLVTPLFAAFIAQHFFIILAMFAHPSVPLFVEVEQNRYTAFDDGADIWRWTNGSAHSLQTNTMQ